MQNIATKSTGDSLTAAEFNQIPDELENVITSTGQSLSGADTSQVAKAIADYAGAGDFYTDSGAADAYVLGVVGSKLGPTAYSTGLRVRFSVGNTNTGASTVNVNALGVKNIKTDSGADPSAGDLTAGQIVMLEYDGTNFVMQVSTSTLTSSFISSAQTITSAGSLTIAHGLGAVPQLVQARVVCTAADNEYAIGDDLVINIGSSNSGNLLNNGMAVWLDATNINVRFGSATNPIQVTRKTSGSGNSITNASWEMYFRAWA